MYKRFVQTGRVALVADGPNKGKLVSIVDVIDQTRALVDGPETGVSRGMMRLNQLHLTKFRIKFPFTGPTRLVRKSWKEAKINEKWAEGSWAKKLDSEAKRRSMTDFDRFKLRIAKRSRNLLRTRAYKRLTSKAKKAGTLYGMKRVKKDGKDAKTSKGKPAKDAKAKKSPEKKAAPKKGAPPAKK